MRTVARYGTWSSPISASMLASAAVGLGEPWLEDGVAYWLELRATEGGRQVLVAGDPHTEPRDLVPEGFNVRTMVHEYGGGGYAIHRGSAFVSSFEDQRLYRIDPNGELVAITPEVDRNAWRYADGRIDLGWAVVDRDPRAARRGARGRRGRERTGGSADRWLGRAADDRRRP